MKISNVCPDRRFLEQFLLGKTPDALRGPLEEHWSDCAACVSLAETITEGDELTESLGRGSVINSPHTTDDGAILQAAIEHAKGLASLLDTQDDRSVSTAILSNREAATCPAETQRSSREFAFLAPAEQDDELGRLSEYRVLGVLGVGGMGIVFKAEDIRLGRPVALKVMRPAIAAKPKSRIRFLREARATATLSHDHVIQIYQVGEDQGVPFIAMQYLEGQSLQVALARMTKLPAIDVARIGKEVALGLAAAHEKGLIHRDIKPDNIWIEVKTGRAKILDFGLARDLTSDAGITQSGTILGTPRYMAPEQVTGENIDHRADLFSLGSMLYHLTSGKPAFAGENIAALLFSITQSAPQPLDQMAPQIDPSLADWIMRLLSKQPEHRPQSAVEVAKQFASIESELTEQASPAPQPIPPLVTAKPAASQNRRPPIQRGLLVTAAGAAAFALILGVIVITIHGPDGTETEIEITKGTQTTLDLAAGSKVTIGELPKQPAGTTDQASGQTPIDPILDRQSAVAAKATQPLTPLGTWDVGPSPPWFGEGGHDAGYSIIGSDVLPGIVERPTKLPSIRRWNVDTKWGRGISLAAHYSPNGEYFATGNSDGHVRIFDATSMDLVSLLPGKTTISGVDDFSWAPDSKRLVVAIPNENVARIWSIDGRLLFEENTDARCHSVAWSPDGKWIAEGFHARVQLRNPDGSIAKVLCKGDGCGPSAGGVLVWHPDGRHLASRRHDGQLVIWDCEDGTFKPLRDPIGHRGFPGHRMAWSRSSVLAVVLGDRLEVYGPDRTLQQTVDYRGRGAIAWHPDDDRLFTWDGESVRSWSVSKKSFVDEQTDASSGWPHQPVSLSCSPNGDKIATAAGRLGILSTDLQTRHFETPIFCRYGTSVSWSHDGALVASKTAGFHPGRPVWTANGKSVNVIPVELESLPLKLAWSPTSYELVGIAKDQSSVISRQMEPAVVIEGADNAYSVVWNPDGTLLAFGTGDGTVKIFSRLGNQITEMIAGDSPAFVAWSAANNELWVHCGRKLTRCRPAESWTLSLVDETSQTAERPPTWYPDGELVVVQNTGWYNREGNLITGPNRKRPHTWRHDGNAYLSNEYIRLQKYFPAGGLIATRYLNGLFEQRGFEYQPHGESIAVTYGESIVTVLDNDLQPVWHAALLPEMKSATFSAAGELIDGDPSVVDPYLVYYYENKEGRIETLAPAKFRERYLGHLSRPNQ